MSRMLAALALAASVTLVPSALTAQDAKTKAPAQSAAKTVKAGKGEKVCRYKFPSGEQRSWVCKQEEPCCAWDLISYVKCGSTITGCL
ncbi:MAG: hypothetical protein KJZ80_06530 [Hyphomicrobiaceae bacterium]|nr:hypothetical protein [Hyphomicrobiaceae bacterium]